MNNLTYFLWIEDSSLDMAPDEEMEDYIRNYCPIPSNEDLCRLEKEVSQ